jgi:hypothetical protein
MYVEYKKSFRDSTTNQETEKWICGDYFKPNPYRDMWEDESKMDRLELYGHRNYHLFSTLAGVRDYSRQIVPISEPKGLPKDCCLFVKTENNKWDCDGHSHSWLTLKEIKDYQNTSPVLTLSGLLSPSDLIKLDEEGIFPNSWCQGTTIEGYERRDWSEPNETLIPLIELMEKRAKELMQYDWQEYDISNDDKIRIIFWFDN